MAQLVFRAALVIAVGCGGGSGAEPPGPDGGGSPGDGTPPAFALEEPVAIGIAGHGLAVADLDGDAADDLVIAIARTEPGAPTVEVRNGRLDRGFVDGGGYPTTVGPSRILLADVTGDQVLDAVIGSLLGRSITVLPGIAGGTFGTEVRSSVDASTNTMLVGAFDAGGALDVVTGEHRSKPDTILFAPGTGDGAFAAPSEIPLGTGITPEDLVAADFDGDGVLDFAASEVVDDLVIVYRGNGDGTFTEATRTAITNAGELAAGDLDHDGDADLVVLAAGRIWAVLGNGDGTLAAPVEYLMETAITRLEVGDLDGDGSLDAIASDGIGDAFHVRLGRGDGSFHDLVTFALDEIQDFAVGDFDADGRPDLAVARAMAGDVLVYFGVP